MYIYIHTLRYVLPKFKKNLNKSRLNLKQLVLCGSFTPLAMVVDKCTGVWMVVDGSGGVFNLDIVLLPSSLIFLSDGIY